MFGVFIMSKMRNVSQKKESYVKQKMNKITEFPKDVTLGVPILTMMGQMELCLENFRGLIEYTEYHIRIQTKYGQIKVTGNHLNVEYYKNDEMKINGNIVSIEYMT